jgi:NCAIR mutase (PurE)-related protein
MNRSDGHLDPHALYELLDAFRRGELDAEGVMPRLREAFDETTARTADACVDLDRRRRCGFSEVIYGEGKTVAALVEIVRTIHAHCQPLLATRVSPEQADAVRAAFPEIVHNPVARTLRSLPAGDEPTYARVPVVTAGTSDRPVAEEALETLLWMGCETELLVDIGVAGPHRLQQALPKIRGSAAVVVAAGMEGALPSVVGGHVDCPVIAVPTSVGYGVGRGGFAALMGMLTSCAANVTVVNIDAGFKAGYVAGLIARQRAFVEG